jgi:hypothetical protein
MRVIQMVKNKNIKQTKIFYLIKFEIDRLKNTTATESILYKL